MRFTVSPLPATAPCSRMASMAYCEQVGVKRQPAFTPKIKDCAGEIVQRYNWIVKIKMCWNRFIQFFNRPARFSAVKKSFSTSANLFPAMELRATKINSTGCDNSFWCNRKLSRSNRRARVRSTAPPILRLVTTPSFGVAPSGNLFQFAIRQPCANRSPCCRNRAKSRFCPSRRARFRRRRFGDSAGMSAIRPA